MTVRAQVLFLIFACLAVFYPSFSAEICAVDDAQLFTSLEHRSYSNPLDTFVRKGKSTLYYRPILGVTFWVDKNVFQINPFWMHLENVLFHLISILLLFYIARLLFTVNKKQPNYFPLFTALLWGLHPLTTESVNWVSGRTDLLAGMFIFGATLLILHYRQSQRKTYLLFAAIASLLAMLSKEVAVAFIPGAILILFAIPATIQSNSKSSNNRLFILFATLATTIPLALFFIIRTGGTISNSSRIGLTLQYMDINLVHSLMLFCRALGFYIKKIFFPWPLNFAILEVDPLYDLLAIPIVILCIWLLWNRSLLAAFFLTGIILLTPSFLIVLNQIAWTPFAERYVYISMAFILLSTIGIFARNPSRKNQSIYSPLMVILLIAFSYSTYQRGLIWHSNLKILEDTSIKSPYSKKIHWVYGAALSKKGDHEKALEVTKMACSLQSPPLMKDYTAERNLGFIYFNLARYNDALDTFKQISVKSDYKYAPALDGLLITYSQLARETNNQDEREGYYKEAGKSGTLLYKIKKDPFIWYNLGKLSLELQKTQQAKEYFTMAYEAFADDSPYKTYAKKLSRK
ncbi:hypothetical protein UWK_02270 [Desulfocapsa sulfexigens DSM 10523]|uniref:Glycosyltransferase RgtA/B/C/D-like domain-containing protein n=1 Tax=Desulfocapsa sulfexigens (strain DSM 10523 / SB164P1) TaxID=1167006 RepID=M1PGP0_DESSD|nr:glycosyltransferase family 39 protein [Desulfocapsa sulfexigens]AGF78810.1 hypothetical protein UWK_02270 [Desulfocapsa sulfexigens DSM 10523]